jgi:hypothetical protein
MLLAEQGYEVVKWWIGHDPVLELTHGPALWEWLQHRKRLVLRQGSTLPDLAADQWPHIILDNVRPKTLTRWGLDPAKLAQDYGVVWVSLRAEVGEVSFDLLAQARSIMDFCPWVPFYLGDTAAGAFMALKALAAYAAGAPGHYVLGHASCVQKLVEGEMVVPVERLPGQTPWDPTGTYGVRRGVASVLYKGELLTEVPRDFAWRWEHLWHDQGRIRL